MQGVKTKLFKLVGQLLAYGKAVEYFYQQRVFCAWIYFMEEMTGNAVSTKAIIYDSA